MSQSDPLLVIINDYINGDLNKLLINSHAFALCKTNDKISTYSDIVEYSNYIVNGIQYSLIRKVRRNLIKLKIVFNNNNHIFLYN